MPKFVVRVEGKLIVQADDKESAVERANTFMSDKGLPGFKANVYNTEAIEDTSILPVE